MICLDDTTTFHKALGNLEVLLPGPDPADFQNVHDFNKAFDRHRSGLSQVAKAIAAAHQNCCGHPDLHDSAAVLATVILIG